jgi:peptide/nickel transport system permease protein
MVDRRFLALAVRLGRSVIGLLLLLVSCFVLMRVIPADPEVLSGNEPWSQRQTQRVWSDEQPLWSSLQRYLGELVTGDLGQSRLYRQPAAEVAWRALPASISLAFGALLLALAGAVLLGAWTWSRHRRASGRLDDLAAMVAAVPKFWLGVLLVFVFHDQLGWLPASHIAGPGETGSGLEWNHLILPALTLAIPLMALIVRLLIAAGESAESRARLNLAWSLGLSPSRCFWRCVALPAAGPCLVLLVSNLPLLISGAAVVEALFAWPGLGRIVIDAIAAGDRPLAMVIVLLVGGITALADLLIRRGA